LLESATTGDMEGARYSPSSRSGLDVEWNTETSAILELSGQLGRELRPAISEIVYGNTPSSLSDDIDATAGALRELRAERKRLENVLLMSENAKAKRRCRVATIFALVQICACAAIFSAVVYYAAHKCNRFSSSMSEIVVTTNPLPTSVDLVPFDRALEMSFTKDVETFAVDQELRADDHHLREEDDEQGDDEPYENCVRCGRSSVAVDHDDRMNTAIKPLLYRAPRHRNLIRRAVRIVKQTLSRLVRS